MTRRVKLCVTLILGAGMATAQAGMPDEYCTYDKFSMAYETPHTAWGKPGRTGSLRAFFLVPSPASREVVELAQRFDITPTVVMTGGGPGMYCELGAAGNPWFLDQAPTKYVRKLLSERLSGTFDVLVIGKFKWDVLPPDVRYAVLDKVCNGCGLVYVGPWGEDDTLRRVFEKRGTLDDSYILRGIPKAALPGIADLPDDELLRTTSFGQGRIVVLRYGADEAKVRVVGGRWHTVWPWNHALTPAGTGTCHWDHEDQPFYRDTPIVYDYLQALLGRCVLWAAGRAPAQVACTVDVAPRLERNATVETAAQVRLNPGTATGPATWRVALRVRGLDGSVAAHEEKSVSVKGPTTLAFRLPVLPAGRFFVDAIASEADRVVDFAVAATDVTASAAITQLQTDKAGYGEAETLTGRVVCRIPPGAAIQLSLAVLDGNGRQLASHGPVPAATSTPETTTEFALPLRGATTQSVRVVASLRDTAGQVHTLTRQVACYPTADYELPFVIGGLTDSYNDYVNEQLLDRTKEYGIDGVYAPLLYCGKRLIQESVWGFTSRGLRLFPYITRLCGEDVLFKDRESTIRAFTDRVEGTAPFRCTYTLGDDQHVSYNAEVGFSPEAMAAFRLYLKRQHGTLEHLNQAWRTNLRDWQDVAADLPRNGLKENGNRAAWIEHRCFMDESFYTLHKDMAGIAKTLDPASRGGAGSLWEATGMQASLVGVDWEQFSEGLNYHGCYIHHPNLFREVRRCWLKPGDLASAIYGGYASQGPNQRRNPAFQSWAPWVSVLHRHQVFFLFALAQGSCEGLFNGDMTPAPCLDWAMAEIRYLKSGLGTLLLNCPRDDNPIGILFSQRNVHINNALKRGDTVASADSLATLLQDTGYQYEMVKLRGLETDASLLARYTVLALPSLVGLSDEQEQVFATFARRGGTLLVAGELGACDEYGFARTGMFADRHGLGPDRFIALDTDKYPTCRQLDAGAELRRRMAECLRTASLAPRVQLAGNEADIHNVERIVHRTGNGHIVSLLYDIEAPMSADKVPCDMTLWRDGHVYDVTGGRYLEKTNTVKNIAVTKGRPCVFAVLPCRVKRLDLDLGKSRYHAGELVEGTLTLRCSDGEPLTHTTAHVQLVDPSGKAPTYCRHNVDIRDGHGTFAFRLAENDRPGKWRVTAREVMAGVEDEQAFHVK